MMAQQSSYVYVRRFLLDPALRILVGFRLVFLWDEAKVTVR